MNIAIVLLIAGQAAWSQVTVAVPPRTMPATLGAAKAFKDSRAQLLSSIEDWKVFLPLSKPPHPLTQRRLPELKNIKKEAARAKAPEDLAAVETRFAGWKNAVLADMYRESEGQFFSDPKRFLEFTQKKMEALVAIRHLRRSKLGQKKPRAIARWRSQVEDATDVAGLGRIYDRLGARRRAPAVAAAMSGVSAEAFVPAAASPQAMLRLVNAEPRGDLRPEYGPVPPSPASTGYAQLESHLSRQGVRQDIIDGVLAQAQAQKVDPILVFAVIKAESDFNPHAKSPVGARGLMQIMPDTGRGLGVSDPSNLYNPMVNIKAGIKYLKYLWGRFSEVAFSQLGSLNPWARADVKSAIAAYNAGPGAVQKYGGVPPYRETRAYVVKVLRYYSQLREAASGPADASLS